MKNQDAMIVHHLILETNASLGVTMELRIQMTSPVSVKIVTQEWNVTNFVMTMEIVQLKESVTVDLKVTGEITVRGKNVLDMAPPAQAMEIAIQPQVTVSVNLDG